MFNPFYQSLRGYDRRSNATCWRTSPHLLLFSEDPVPAERAVPAVQRPQERVSTERGRGEHEQPVPVPQEVAVPEAPPRRRRHPRQGVHGHDSQDLQWVLHVSDRMGHGSRRIGRTTVKEGRGGALPEYSPTITYKLQLYKCCDEF